MWLDVRCAQDVARAKAVVIRARSRARNRCAHLVSADWSCNRTAVSQALFRAERIGGTMAMNRRRLVTSCCWRLAVGATLLVGLQASVARAGSCSVETWEQLRQVGYGSISQVAYSPDGRRIAVATSTGVVLWNEEQGQVERVLTGPAHLVAWSPDGTRIASGAAGSIKVWDADSGTLLLSLGHAVNSVAWSPDGTRIASGGAGSVIEVWDAESGALLRTLTGHTDTVNSVVWSPDGTRIASGSGDFDYPADTTVRVWDADSGALLRTLFGTGSVNSVAWSPDGTRIAGGSFYIKVWDAESGALLL